MLEFVGTITFENEIFFEEKNLEFLKISDFNNEFSYFLFWKIPVKSGEELIDYFSKKWKILELDISLENEDNFQIFLEKMPKNWKYELVSFEGELIELQEIIERFEESYEIVSVREAEVSQKFWNRIIKAEFIY